MGNCCGTQRKQADEGHQLHPINHNSSGGPLGGSNSTELSTKEAMLNAAEKRKLDAERRGIKKGGKLSKQLSG
ncbi:hypothetical protein BY458DRAFT_512049 [Sporodiniella umbellata]|nr:hypothetical protein BY458DRAFT_512049 [Sporodiniella umbellata]